MYTPINGWTKTKIVNHIVANFKGKSYNPDSKRGSNTISGVECLYRGPEGKKCVMGVFIPDDKYEKYMEQRSASAVITEFRLHDIIPLSKEALDLLQDVHDKSLESSTLEEIVAWVDKNVGEDENV
jgi:hypothetical protein